MPKSIEIDPSEIRTATTLKTADIKVHAYSRPLADERALRGNETLKRVLRHMLIIREFETGIASLKAQGSYGPLTYNYKGPAHLSIGQEAAAVGAALALKRTDHIYGSHRSHGEFLAKGLAAIDALDDDALEEIMERHQGGALLHKVTRHYRPASTKEAAEAFLLSGFLAEMFTRDDGFNGGMGGSMHAFFLPFGAYPNNAIVGASAGIAVGAALQMRLENRDDIAVSMVGDGATGCGPVWEAMNFAGMAQFETLWEKTGGLPVLFFFTNNFYAMGGQTKGETMAWDRLSRIGAGLRPDAYHGETVDGTDPLAVADAVAAKRSLILEGNGPAILDVECYRFSGHSTTDVNAYRTKDEIAAWQTVDPISSYRGRLAEADILGTDASQTMAEDVEALLHRVYETVADPSKFPPVNVHTEPTLIGQKMFSNAETPPSNSPPAPLKDPSTTIRVRQNAKKARTGVDEDGKLYSPMKAINLRDGLFEAILHHMLEDPRITAFGEECREWGGAFGVYRGLSDIFPHERMFNSPISEAAIVATAVGAAMEGGRPIIELMYADFLGRAGDEVFNQLAKWQAMSNQHLSVPVVLRCSVGSKYGAQHSQDWSALAAHIPGLKIVYPATPFDAKGLMSAAIASDDPVLFFESQRLYDRVEQFQPEVPVDDYRVQIGMPDVKRVGEDVTVLTIGPSLYQAIEAAEALAESGVSLEIIDARSLVPFDYEPVLKSVEKTGRLLLVTEASERGSFPMTLAANIGRFAFESLKAAPRVLGSPNWIVPSGDLESTYFPQAADIEDVVMAELLGSHGYNRKGVRNWDDMELAKSGL